ncbi:hypothetical protein [Halalkalibacter okhensis]|uniref:hypothetical protein n=1 Tax=Halalkalibacter okhensis TaxID=333138 RepID=UPI00126A3F3E|nr:hypothetical protein [Halalkalibacter okhensis]
MQKKQLKRAANTTPSEQSELQDPATLEVNEPQDQPNASNEEGTAEELALTDKKKKKKKDKDKKKKKKK